MKQDTFQEVLTNCSWRIGGPARRRLCKKGIITQKIKSKFLPSFIKFCPKIFQIGFSEACHVGLDSITIEF